MSEFQSPFFLHGGVIVDKEEIANIDLLYDNLTENMGNGYIIYSLLNELFGKTIKPNQNLLLYPNVEKDVYNINNNSSCAILLLQDFIRPKEIQFNIDYDLWYNLLSKIKVPLFFPSVGINSFDGLKNLHKRLSPEVVKILKYVSYNTELIGCRGYETQEVLHNLGIDNVRVIGCPTYFKNGRNRIIKKKENIDLNKVVFSSEHNIEIIKNHNVIIQGNNKSLWDVLCFNKSILSLDKKSLYIMINSKPIMFSDNQSWEEYLRNFDFCIGARLLGSIVALNSGVPAVCLNTDARTKELCSYLKIPYLPEFLYENDIRKIIDNSDFSEMNKNYNSLYDNYMDYLDKSGIRKAVNADKYLNNIEEFRSPNIECKLSFHNKCLIFWIKLLRFFFYKEKYKTHRNFTIIGIKFKIKRKQRNQKK